jgi:hypothetical protein
VAVNASTALRETKDSISDSDNSDSTARIVIDGQHTIIEFLLLFLIFFLVVYGGEIIIVVVAVVFVMVGAELTSRSIGSLACVVVGGSEGRS